jgi:hypothetical protein
VLRTLPLKNWIVVLILAGSLVTTLLAALQKENAASPIVSITSISRAPSASILFSTGTKVLPAIAKFESPEFVYARIFFGEQVFGKNKLEARWITPAGYLQEFTQVPLDFGSQGGNEAYLWLQFHDDSSGGGVTWTTQSGERTTTGFNGAWTLQTFLNGQPLVCSTFSVSGMPSTPSN